MSIRFAINWWSTVLYIWTEKTAGCIGHLYLSVVLPSFPPTVQIGVETSERRAEHLHEITAVSQVRVHVLEVGVNVVAIPGGGIERKRKRMGEVTESNQILWPKGTTRSPVIYCFGPTWMICPLPPPPDERSHYGGRTIQRWLISIIRSPIRY